MKNQRSGIRKGLSPMVLALMKMSAHIPLERPEGLCLLAWGRTPMHCIRSSFLTLRILIKCYKRSVEGPVSFFKSSLLIMLLQLSHFPPSLHSKNGVDTPPPTFLPYSSCPWVIHINSLASTFPILFLTSPCLFCTYHVCFLFPVLFPAFSPTLLMTIYVISISMVLFLF